MKKTNHSQLQSQPELAAKMEELLQQSLHYNREMTRIHRELAELRARMRALEDDNAGTSATAAKAV